MTEPERALRLFVAVKLSLSAASAIGEVAQGLARAARERGVVARFAAPAGYHVTLGFLGWTRPEAVTAVRDRVGHELDGARGFPLRTIGLGGFPEASRARVLWVGVDDREGRVADLATRVGRAMTALGFQVDKRPFHPHVTLARFDQASDLDKVVATPSERLRSETWVDSVTLFESITKAKGSEYSTLAEWPLESGSKSPRRQTKAVERAPDSKIPPASAGADAVPEDGPEETGHGEQGNPHDDPRH